MLIPVLLYGFLAKKYGKRHMLAVSSPAEAVRAMKANYPEFERDIVNYQPGFHLFRGKENIGKEQIQQPSGLDAIRIVPAITGAKQGVVQTIIGVIIIVVSLIADYFTGGYFGEITQYTTYKIGATMILSGIVQMLTAPPAAQSPQEANANNQPSYVFNGPVNTISQGHPVQVGYGRMKVGSAVLSGGIFVEQIDQAGNGDIGTMRVGKIIAGIA